MDRVFDRYWVVTERVLHRVLDRVLGGDGNAVG